MQLKYSLEAVLALVSLANAQNYVSVQYMDYDEDSGRTTIHSPYIELNLDLGVDYTLNISGVIDSLSGASPTYYDSSSGASAKLPKGDVLSSDIVYGDIPYSDKRKAFGINLTKRLKTRDELSVGYNYSNENDYTSNEVSIGYLHYLDKSKNRSIDFGLSFQKNKIKIGCYLGNSECDGISGASSKVIDKYSYVLNTQIGFTQIIDKSSLVKMALFYINEHGYLSNPYMRVVRYYNTNPQITQESKPNSRRSYGISIEYDKSLSDKLSTLFSYRLYHDSWNITSHTFESQLFYDFNEKLRLGLNLRAYHQSKAEFFSGRRDYFTNQKYASSDRRVGEITSYTASVSAEYKINSKFSINGAVGYYKQVDYFHSNFYNIGFKYRF